ncbi:MAG: hypothetical protein D6718_02630 [Acidobacteria bacterium]|nr:MAG: hypothetical protein D6718_02630 [Acidobacteriota bacterium]
MFERRRSQVLLAAVVAAAASLAPALSAGFGIFEQGSKAMGMAGAFTAQADDGSALFHNVAGIAFQRERSFQLGGTAIWIADSKFRGLAPFPGPSAAGRQTDAILFPPHFYYVQPLGDAWSFGIGVNTPFGLATEWDDPDAWPGRFVSERAELRAFDVFPSVAVRVGDRFAMGVSLVARFSDVELKRRAAAVDPFLNQTVEIARVVLDSDLENDFAFNVGLMYRPTDELSIGLSYRDGMSIDYHGKARFTQVPTGNQQFDLVVAQSLPFGQEVPIATTIGFPEMLSLGLAYRFSDELTAEADFNWTGWSAFERLDIDFSSSQVPDVVRGEDWKDVWNYRAGVNWRLDDANELRFGFVYDQTPQPDKSVSPLLPDATRTGFTFGYGRRGKATFDVALMFLPFKKRTTTVSQDLFNGTYDSTIWLLGATVGF